MKGKTAISCSFCGRPADEVAKLFVAPEFKAICDECIDMFAELLHNDRQNLSEPGHLTPIAPCPEPLLGAWFRKRAPEADGGVRKLEFDQRGLLISTTLVENVETAKCLTYSVAGNRILQNQLLPSRHRETVSYALEQDGSLVLKGMNGASIFVRK